MYFTKSGQQIYNPKAYAKTGAPMYTDRNGKNINKKTDIYLLELENGKKYVGKTTDFKKRMQQHFNRNGSKVTQKFSPIKGQTIDSCYGFFSNKIEQKHTKNFIKTYGYNNVRGGSYVNSKTLKTNSTNSTNSTNTCFKGRKQEYYANNCYNNNNNYNLDYDSGPDYDSDF